MFQHIKHLNVNCTIFLRREVGASPTCWFYNGQLNGTLKYFNLKSFISNIRKKDLESILEGGCRN